MSALTMMFGPSVLSVEETGQKNNNNKIKKINKKEFRALFY